ncbi:discoidin domain-containing protein [Cohnella sp.]|uniref:discoidin domain-containing protein n=1 Tax=Cohnella sp. TaxID=1883426 RepID=UPI0037044B5F
MKIRKAIAAGGLLAASVIWSGFSADASNMDLQIDQATASSFRSGYEPAKASDNVYGNADNGWAADAPPSLSSPQWIKFDLGSAQYVGALELYPNVGHGPRSFTIETSLDDVSYEVRRTVDLAADKRSYFDWTPSKARYLKINITSGFNDDAQIREAYWFSEILPHRVSTLSAGDLYDFSRLTENGFDALKRANIQLVNPIIVGHAPDFTAQTLPNGGNPNNDADYDWTYADELADRFASHGIDLFIGQNLGLLTEHWPQLKSPLIDENGSQFVDEVKANPFVSDTLSLYSAFNRKVAGHFSANPFVRLQAITGPGYFGGIEIFGGDIVNPTLWVYDEHAKQRFREWLQTKYATIAEVNSAWGTSYSGWNEVQPPKPLRTNMPGAFDNRQSWSDLMFWLRDHLANYTRQTIEAVRSATDKPLYIETDGGYLFSPMESQASLGLSARIASDYKPFVFASSGGDESFGAAGIAAAARLHGFDTAIDNANYETRKLSDDTMFFIAAKGIGTFNNSNMAEDFAGDGWTGAPHTNGWDPAATYAGTEEFRQYAERSGRLLAVDPLPEGSQTAIYHSFYSSNYRKGYRYDDYMRIYDRDHGLGFNVRPFASWSHYLDTPDAIDDFLIEDGALKNYKLLVSANSSLTLTSDVAQEKLLDWVENGHSIVGFGKDSFNYKLNLASRSISGDENVSSWMMGVSGGSAAAPTAGRTASVAANKPAWLTSLKAGETAGFTVSDSSQAQAFTALLPGATPVLTDEHGNALMVEYRYGSGRVLFSTIPVSDSEMFYDGFMGKILSDFADASGVERKVKFDGDRYHVAYMGVNKQNDKGVAVVADPPYMANGQFSPEQFSADPQYYANGQTLRIETDASLNGLPMEVEVTAPWTHATGGTIHEQSGALPQKRILHTASATEPLLIQSLRYGSLPVVGVQADMHEKPYSPDNVADGLKEDSGAWKSGSASPDRPQTLTVDLGAVYSVSGMELYPWTDDDGNELFSFESGSYQGWTVSGTAFGTAPTTGTHFGAVSGMKGAYWADSQWGGETAVGTIRSPGFMIDKDILSVRIVGYDGPAGTDNRNRIYVRRAADDAILYTIKPPQSDTFVTQRLEVKRDIGTKVYLEVVDDNSSPLYGWLGVDALALSSYKENKEISDYSFEQGSFDDWTVTGTAFGAAPTSSDHGGLVKGWRGRYWADSQSGGDPATGTLTSGDFLPEKELLTFRIAGYDGGLGDSDLNFVYLRKASDDSILFAAKPPQSDAFETVTWDVTPYMGTRVYLEVVDGNFGGLYGWLGVDDFTFSGNYGFERGTYSGWTTTGTGFGTAPTYQKSDPNLPWSKKILKVPGYDGKYYAATHAEGNGATGTLTSKSFVVQKPVLSYRAAGYDGRNGTNDQNYYWLIRASDGVPLYVAKPPQAGHFVQQYWDVSDYIGTEVYIKVEDNVGYEVVDNADYGWIAIDDIVQLENFDFEIGSWAGWTATGTAFGDSPQAYSPLGSVDGVRGTYYAASYPGGEAATGTLKSRNFRLENGTFSFRKAGYDGPSGTSGLNYFYLRRASDGAVLFSAKPPQSDAFAIETWDVSAYVGTEVYFEAVDGHSAGANAWLAVDDLQWRGAGPKSFTVQTSLDGASWGTPVLAVTDQGNKVDSYSWSPSSARYLRLNVTEGYADQVAIKELTFRKELAPWTIASVTASSEAAGYEAVKAIDGIAESDSNMWAPIGTPPAWIQFDLGGLRSIRAVEVFARNNALAQRLGPKEYTIRVSADGLVWTDVYTAVNNGENDAIYAFPEIEARYVKLDVSKGWNDTAQIREVKIYP